MKISNRDQRPRKKDFKKFYFQVEVDNSIIVRPIFITVAILIPYF